MKANQRQGDTLDEELDFYRDDDDVTTTLPSDGSRVWILSNIEEVAAARGTVNPRRALAGNSSSYLLGLEKDYKPRGVFIDDPKGLFILRCTRRSTRTARSSKATRTRNASPTS